VTGNIKKPRAIRGLEDGDVERLDGQSAECGDSEFQDAAIEVTDNGHRFRQ